MAPPTSPTRGLSPTSTGVSDSPPEYTPTADTNRGESTILETPLQPHQTTPNRPLEHRYLNRRRSGGSQLPNDPQLQSGYTRQHHSRTSFASLSDASQDSTRYVNAARINRPITFPPPHQPSSPRQPSPPPASSTTSLSVLPTIPPDDSDFTRDFYAVGDFYESSPNDGTPFAFAQLSTTSSYASSASSPSAVLSQFSLDNTPAASETTNGIPDDGRPTSKPVLGHPLLRDGKTLVYPSGYQCNKCQNTGYMEADPSHPCMKCWRRYAKPYAGPLAYAPFNTPDTQPATRQKSTFQRPLYSSQTLSRHLQPQPQPAPIRPYAQPTLAFQSSFTSPCSMLRQSLVSSQGSSRTAGKLCRKRRGASFRVQGSSLTCEIGWDGYKHRC